MRLPKDRTQPEVFAKRLLELYGGRDAANEIFERQLKEINERWNQNIDIIGRILRAHLFVEHYLNEYLQFTNPKLGDLEEARLGFSQKVALLDARDPSINYLIPGIRRLNSIRNRLAHSLQFTVVDEDARVLLDIGSFAALRRALAAPGEPSMLPIVVLEDFAKHSGSMLRHAGSADAAKWKQALEGT